MLFSFFSYYKSETVDKAGLGMIHQMIFQNKMTFLLIATYSQIESHSTLSILVLSALTN